MYLFVDFTGIVFKNITVVSQAERRVVVNPDGSIRRIIMWNCICNCGENIVRDSRGVKLDRKCKKCANKSQIKEKVETVRLASYRLKTIWSRMKDRCYNSKHISFKYYGHRGIIICDEWINDFYSFEKWALNNGYGEKLTLDRIDNKGNYEPSNCRWATRSQQQNNRSDNRKFEYNGQKLTAREIASLTGKTYEQEYYNQYKKTLL